MASDFQRHCPLVLLFFSLQLLCVLASASQKLESSFLVKRINRRGPYIGLITVFSTEDDAFLSTVDFRPNPSHPFVDLSGRRFRIGRIQSKKVIYVKCGIGMVNAAAATQQMLDVFRVGGVVHFGIAGNLNDSMSIGDVTIPKLVASTGIWDWLNPNSTSGGEDLAFLEIGDYNVPEEEGLNMLGRIGYSYELLFSRTGQPNAPQKLFWMEPAPQWLHLATHLEGMELLQCVNSSLCLPEKPKLVVGLKASTANVFVDNAAYRNFLYDSFGVSSSDMESSAVVMTCMSNGYPAIVIRGLSDLAGAQRGDNAVRKFGSLAATNTALAVLEFLKKL